MTRITTPASGTALALIATALAVPSSAHAEPASWEDREVSVLAGGTQPLLLSGWNAEVDVRIGRVVVGYSHGWSLDIDEDLVRGAARQQQLAYHLPYSTGLGIGYRVTDALDVRIEPKLHRFDVHYQDARADSIATYRTFTLGAGIYYAFRPFRGSSGWQRGLTLSSSIRYWPRLWSSLSGDELSYANRHTGRTETHAAADIGIANTPWVVNVSAGYAFDLAALAGGR